MMADPEAVALNRLTFLARRSTSRGLWDPHLIGERVRGESAGTELGLNGQNRRSKKGEAGRAHTFTLGRAAACCHAADSTEWIPSCTWSSRSLGSGLGSQSIRRLPSRQLEGEVER